MQKYKAFKENRGYYTESEKNISVKLEYSPSDQDSKIIFAKTLSVFSQGTLNCQNFTTKNEFITSPIYLPQDMRLAPRIYRTPS